MLFLGDSLSRRLTATLAEILIHSHGVHEAVERHTLESELNNGGHEQFKWPLNTTEYPTRCLHYAWAAYFADLNTGLIRLSSNLKKSATAPFHYNTIMISAGVHDAQHTPATHPVLFTLAETICQFAADNTALTFIWRSAPPCSNAGTNKLILETNLFMKEAIMGQHGGRCATLKEDIGAIHILDAENILIPVAIGTNRIAGDSGEHFGLQARLALIQALIHILLTDAWEIENHTGL